MWTIVVLLSVVLANFNCHSAPLFGALSQPLLESSLEQTIDNQQQRASIPYESTEDKPPKCHDDSTEYSQEESDEKIFDLLLKILRVLDEQAYRDAERARRLQMHRATNVINNSYQHSNSNEESDSDYVN
ncbi:uncharacterized protein LOC129779553 isoform X2 [Toxorhynchites rutilus septentrionalis]|uniref:uncharacterized protein LOC129779553 isoform X2 n=1 Tax=Toxorhynchites rutilus septentrionalis TaxID=329112 RepID=UPI00247A9E38|nr:uncharacterized protein LOC129779553 isoform X2 [Toxorhynchites rutilus septentrionalis]